MLLTTMDQDRLARLRAAEEKRKRGLTLVPPSTRSALVAALLAQSQFGQNAPIDGVGLFSDSSTRLDTETASPTHPCGGYQLMEDEYHSARYTKLGGNDSC